MLSWSTLPPFISLPILIGTILLAGGGERYFISLPFWALFIMSYITCTFLYAFFVTQNYKEGYIPLQFLAQGMLITMLAQHLGNPESLIWVGVATSTVGFILFANIIIRKRESDVSVDFSKSTPKPEDVLTDDSSFCTIPVPILVTDENGLITNANEAFLSLIDQKKESLLGKIVTEIISLDTEKMVLKGKEWHIQQKQQEGAFFFFLSEDSELNENNEPHKGFSDLLDSDLPIYTFKYSERRLPEEISRAHRYRRWLSAALFKMDFHKTETGLFSSDDEDDFFKAFCNYVFEKVRESDLCFRMGNREVLVLMPETPQNGAKELAIRLSHFPKDVSEEYDIAETAQVYSSITFYNGNQETTAEKILQALYSNLA